MRLVSVCRVRFLAPLVISLLSVSLLLQSWACAQDANPLTATTRTHIESVLRGLPRGINIYEVAVSPDGKRVAWTVNARDGEEIFLAPIDNLEKTQSVATAQPEQTCDERSVAWSPDSNEIAFLSDCASRSGQDDLYISHMDGQPARKLTQLHGYVNAPSFSPNGKFIAFLYVPGSMRQAGALAAQAPNTGVIGETTGEVQRIALIWTDAPATAAPSLVSPEYLHAYEFDWSPDSRSLAYIAADPPGENNWWTARLYSEQLAASVEYQGATVIRRVDGQPPKLVLDPEKISGALHGLQIAVPRWSPDGNRIAFVGGLMSDQGVTGGDVWIISADGGEPRDLTPGRRATPAWITWAGDKHLFVDETAGGGCRLVRLTLHGGPQVSSLTATADAPVFSFPGTVGDGRMAQSLSFTANRSLFIFEGNTFDAPPEIYAARPAKTASAAGAFPGVEQISHFDAGVKPAWGKSVSVEWINEGFHVQGWLTLPVNYDPAAKYPLIVEVHGGPAAAVLARWNAGGMLSASSFSALGYFVLQPNPRGSFGQGEAFTQANRRDFGYGDLRDILAGVDKVEAKYPIDPNRIGIAGWSYGGFMTMFAVTQTQRFKAARAGAGISDWLSYYGENSIDQWMLPFFGSSVYDDPAIYTKSSAINFIKKARTPTLMAVGDRDGECPAPQSFEFWHALRDLGVPTELVVYPNEGHGLANPDHRRDVELRTMEWFAKYLPAR
jgi:dipeptidyl aminopeptidase/acylaminoacyl peptidase